jgi:hypothetical protein
MSSQLSVRARLVVAACMGVAAAILFIILFWVFTGTLEDWETLVAGGVLLAILAGIAALARKERVLLSGWLLVGLLTLLISADLPYYGVGTPTAAAYVIPIVLAARLLGFWPGMGVAAFGATVIWLIAWATTSGVYSVDAAIDISHLTFNAPALTVIFGLVALIVGYRSKTD